jgi:hypothetical protein
MSQSYEFLLEVNDDGKARVTFTAHQGSLADKPQELREYSIGCKFPGSDFEMTAQASQAGQMFVVGRNEVPSQSLLQRMGVGRKK